MNVLEEPRVSATLKALNEAAEADHAIRQYNKKHKIVDADFLSAAYLAVKPEQGELLYCLATISGAKSIVEYGCSLGVSSIYLAAAAKHNHGFLVTTDIEIKKVEGARENLQKAGLLDYARVLPGNALETLATVKDSVDFLFLDGANELYLPIFELLHPRLSPKAIIIADNANKGGAAAYVEHMQRQKDTFTSIPFFGDRMLVSYRT